MRYYRPIAVASLFFVCACGPDDPYVGRMDDASYGRKIPSHILYSPEGHALFRHERLLSTTYIRKVLEERMAEWHEWNRNGVTADWMK